MPLQEGTRLGPYEILAPAGAGGMGEVYRGRDTRLDRTVAIKVLPAEVAGSASRRQRLEREARTISQLSHPHICALHDIGHEDGVDFLVMEFLEGETLEHRLGRGPLPMARVLEIGEQVAAALDAAHRQGVTHRDLKPGNIMLTATGAKLLDFGLAKLEAPGRDPDGRLSAAPTADSPLTVEGVLLGTLQYMAPEQLEGREADARSDIWALGLVLHEMATGTIVFEGQSQAALIAAILERDPPPLAAVCPASSPALEHLVDRCLRKDPEDRWQSTRDLLMELRWIREAGPAAPGSGVAPERSRLPGRTLWAATLLALVAALVFFVLRRPPASEGEMARFALPLPPNAVESRMQVSPDGRMLSVPAETNGQMQLWVRPIDSLVARPLPGTEGVSPWYHFWSPDSRFLGFVAEGKLKIIDVNGGPPRTVTEVPGRGPFSLGTWGSAGTILYNVTEAPGAEGLFRVPAAGGVPTRLSILDEAGQEMEVSFPSFLPDGKHFLFEALTEDGKVSNCVADVDTLQVTRLLDVLSYVMYTEPGYLLYVRDGALMAHRFDADTLRLSGEPVVVVPRVEAYGGIGMPSFAASRRVLVYNSGRGPSRLLWRDRSGREMGQVGEPDIYGSLRLSPEGKRLMVSIGGGASRDLWTFDLARNVATRFTSGAADVYGPVWSPDGNRIVFSMPVKDPPNLHVQSLDQDEPEELLPSTGTMQWASDWSRDGRLLMYSQRDPDRGWDLWILPMEGDGDPRPYRQTAFHEFDAQLSPDGRRVAFVSDESGEPQVYVMPFEGPGEKRRISISGGRGPRWRSDGREMFYVGTDNRVMAVPISMERGFAPGTPTALFPIDPADDDEVFYDVGADGQRFIINSALPGTRPAPTVLLDWTAKLPR